MNSKNDKNQTVIMVMNSYLSVVNFRLPLINSVSKTGKKVTLAVFNLHDDERIHLKALTGCEVVSISFGRGYKSFLTDFISLLKFLIFIREQKYHWVVSFMIKPIFITWIINKFLDYRQVNIFEGLGFLSEVADYNNFTRYIVTNLLKGMTKNARNIVLNETDLQFFKKLKVKNLAKVAGIGVDLGKYREKTSRDEEYIQFGFAGRLIRSKGILCYLEAARIVSMHSGNVRFHIFGDFDDNPGAITRADLEPYIKLPNIEFHGYVDMPNAIQNIDVLVLPSKREGFSVVLMEAFASGIPVIGANVPGVNDAIVNDVNGLLFDYGSVDQLVEKMFDVISCPKLIATWGNNARDYAVNNFNCYNQADLMNNIITAPS